MKNVQIEYSLFVKLLLYHIAEEFEYAAEIEKELQSKLDKMINHENYTKYKTAETEEERREAILKYLDAIGVPESFRW